MSEIRVFASGDHHFEEGPRWEECLMVHAWMADLVAREKPNVFLSAGDVYERASTPNEREAVAEWVTQIAEVCPVVIARGNHDARRDCALLARLRTKHPVIVEERAGVHVVGGVAVAAVAWPSKASLAAQFGQPVGGDAVNMTARDALTDLFLGIAQEWPEGLPRILLGHFMIDGSESSNGQPLCGVSLNVGLADLGLAGADITIAGHIHKPQDWLVGGAPVLYTGSPFRHDFGENEEKSITVIEFETASNGTRHQKWDRISTPARPMLLLEDEWGWCDFGDPGDGWLVGWHGHPGLEKVRGAEVRLRYYVPSDKRAAAREAVALVEQRLRDEGAVLIQVEERVRVETRARAPEIEAAATLADQVEGLWKAKGFEPGDRRAALLNKIGQLETEAA